MSVTPITGNRNSRNLVGHLEDTLRQLYPGLVAHLLVRTDSAGVPVDADEPARRLKLWETRAGGTGVWRSKIAKSHIRVGGTRMVRPGWLLALRVHDDTARRYLDEALPDSPWESETQEAIFFTRVPDGVKIKPATGVEFAPRVKVDVLPGGPSAKCLIPVETSRPTESGAPWMWERELPTNLKSIPLCPQVFLDCISGKKRLALTPMHGDPGDLVSEAPPVSAPIVGTEHYRNLVDGALLEAHRFDRTDTGNARRFVAQHGEVVKFNAAGHWLAWDGKRLAPDQTGEIMRRAKLTALTIYREAEQATDKDEQQAIVRWALQSQAEARLRAMVNLAASEPGVTVLADQLDANPYLMNVANGTLDLRTQELRPHDQGDLITMLTPVVYDPKATFDRWDKFLEDAVPEEPTRDFMQLGAGYTLLGKTGADVLMVILGPPRSGKGCYQQALSAALGEYGTSAGLEDFAHRRFPGGARPELARLRGRRMVSVYETSSGIRLSASWIKTLCGSDEICVRDLYDKPFTYTPAFTLYIATNHPPRLPPDDSAIWERVRRLSFDRVVPEAERDPSLRTDLADPKVGGPAVLAWAVEGCRRYLNQPLQGLIAPEKVKEDGEALRRSQDTIGEFFEECCDLGDGKIVTAEQLRRVYEEWCQAAGEDPLAAKIFGERLRGKGCEPCRPTDDKTHRQVRSWRGITLKDSKTP